jgi:CBS domain-containing protein
MTVDATPSTRDAPEGSVRARRPLAALAALTAADVMSAPPVAVQAHESLLSAWELLDRGRFRHLPVVGSDGRCLSLIDDRAVARELSSPSSARSVADIMPSRVHCVLPGTDLQAVAQIMIKEQATAVPVIDVHHRLLGIVTDRDLVALVAGDG